jgi:hypothetical protein
MKMDARAIEARENALDDIIEAGQAMERRIVRLEDMPGPNRLAAQLRDDLDANGAVLEDCRDRAERSRLNKQRHRLKELLRWCETRAGYVPGIGE